MSPTFERLFRAPYGVPNGVQTTADGLWIADQISDRVALVQMTTPSEYGVTPLLREIPSESSNTSGLSEGDGSLWLAANGAATIWRGPRPMDAKPGYGEILRIDPATGVTQDRWPVPGNGGVHGIEYDAYEPGHLWITTLRQQTLSQVRIADWSVQRTIPLPYGRAHGVVRIDDVLWIVHTADRVILKLTVDDGRELDRIIVPPDQPEPHCLTRLGDDLLYCDATSGWIMAVRLN
jgi:sugar lactone lactonase YvrE